MQTRAPLSLLAAAAAGFVGAAALGVGVLATTGLDVICKKQILCSVSNDKGWASQVHLSWQQDPARSLTVTWRTAKTGSAYAEVRPAGDKQWTRVQARSSAMPRNGVLPRRGAIHRATFSGLQPQTDYEYRVSHDAATKATTSEVFRTRTAPPPGPQTFSFLFFSDTGTIGRPDGLTEGTRKVRDFMIASDAAFLLGGGDYAYGDADARAADPAIVADEWFRQWQPLLSRVPLMAQYGNHESFLRESLSDWLPRFSHPRGYRDGRAYSFDVGNAHFAAMYAPGDGYVPPPDLLDWLDKDLGAARRRGARWLIVYQHDSIYGHGLSHPANPRVRAALMPIFDRHGVELHLSAQDQNYERTYPLRTATPEAAIGSRHPDTYRASEGTVYAKVSPAGKMSERTRDFSLLQGSQPPQVAVRSDRGHHFARVTVHGDDRIEVSVFELLRGDAEPTVLDHFVIHGSTVDPSPAPGPQVGTSRHASLAP